MNGHLNTPAAPAPDRCWRSLGFGRRETFLLGSVVFVILALAILFPAGFLRAAPACPIHGWTSFYCASCGTTRAIVSLLHGDWAAALRYNFLFMLSLALSVPVLGIAAVRSLRESRIWVPTLSRPFWISLLSVAVLFMILRNLPFAPFNQLAP